MGSEPVFNEQNISIIERCQKGERRAFQELYNLYADAMFNVAVRILNDHEEAKEILQDAFLKTFENIKDYDKNYSYGVWLKRILINLSLDRLKKKKLNFQSFEHDNYTEEESIEEDDSLYDINTIRVCIQKLPDGYRTILSLYLFEDQSHKEIAMLLGISEGTSKSQYNRGKKKLIELLKQSTVSHGR